MFVKAELHDGLGSFFENIFVDKIEYVYKQCIKINIENRTGYDFLLKDYVYIFPLNSVPRETIQLISG